MSIKLVVQGVPDVAPLQNLNDPVEAEATYLRVCSTVRTDGPGAVKISSRIPGVPDAYFRLDRDWDTGREQHPERMGIWTDTAEGYTVPTLFQLRGAARALGLSGEEIARRLGVTGRLWRYWLADETERRETPWMAWRVLRLWLSESLEPPKF